MSFDTQKYCDWINEWVDNDPDISIKYVGKAGKYLMFHFGQNTPKLRECPNNDAAFMDGEDVFFYEPLINVIIAPVEEKGSIEERLAIFTIGSILGG